MVKKIYAIITDGVIIDKFNDRFERDQEYIKRCDCIHSFKTEFEHGGYTKR